jgi:hypothetical protein
MVSKTDGINFVLASSFSEVKILHQAKFDSLRIRTRLGVGAFVRRVFVLKIRNRRMD